MQPTLAPPPKVLVYPAALMSQQNAVQMMNVKGKVNRDVVDKELEGVADVLGHIRGHSNAMHNCSEYIKLTKMNKPHVWGTSIELFVVAHLLKSGPHCPSTHPRIFSLLRWEPKELNWSS